MNERMSKLKIKKEEFTDVGSIQHQLFICLLKVEALMEEVMVNNIKRCLYMSFEVVKYKYTNSKKSH